MNRRAFLQTLGFGTIATAAAAITTFDIERALWLPSDRTIFIPSESIETFNTLLTPTWVTKEVARIFMNDLKFVSNFDRSWERSSQNESQAISIRAPVFRRAI